MPSIHYSPSTPTMTGWEITVDHIHGEDPSQVGRASDSAGYGLTPGKRRHFRLYDDDGILYYEGYLGDDDNADTQFNLIAWGAYFAGTSALKVRRDNGRYVQDVG